MKHELGGDPAAWVQHFIAARPGRARGGRRRDGGAFLVGDAVSFADVYLVPQLYAARRFSVDLEAFPTLLRAEASCAALPAFVAAHPDQQPERHTSREAVSRTHADLSRFPPPRHPLPDHLSLWRELTILIGGLGMKSKLGLAEIALTLFAAAHLAACGSSSSEERHRRRDAAPAAPWALRPTEAWAARHRRRQRPTAPPRRHHRHHRRPRPLHAPDRDLARRNGGAAGGRCRGRVDGDAPQFDMTTADDQYTILKFLANFGSVASTFVTGGVTVTTVDALTPDNWDPVTNGIGDVSTFTPMFTVAADGSGIVHHRAGGDHRGARRHHDDLRAHLHPGQARHLSRDRGRSQQDLGAADHALRLRSRRVAHGDRLQQRQQTLAGGTAPLGTSGSATFTNSSAASRPRT